MYIGKSREQLSELPTPEVKEMVVKDAWVTLKQYFDGIGNGPQAKIACVVLSTDSRDRASDNNRRALDLAFQRMSEERKQLK